MSRQSIMQFCTRIVALTLVLACGEKPSGGAKKDDSTAASAPAAPAVGPASAPDPTPVMTDANVLAKLDADNVADSSAGALAATKGTSASVKQFGRMMMNDHHAMRVEGAAVASRAGIKAVMPPGDADAAVEAALAKSMTTLPGGPAWDKFFADHQVVAHTKVLQFAQDAVNHTQNAELKTMIQKAAPTVQKHLDKAKALQGALGGTPAAMKTSM